MPTEVLGRQATAGREAPVEAPRPVWGPALVGLAGLALVNAIDYLTGSEVSFSLFYLLPISFVTWVLGGRWGSAACVVAAAGWYLADQWAGAVYSAAWIPYWNTIIRLGFFLVTMALLDRLRTSHAAAIRQSLRDPLTGLFNERGLREGFVPLAASARGRGHLLALVFADVDGLKGLNDSQGHASGSAMLAAAGQAVQASLRQQDIASRFGGDEFILVGEVDSPEAAWRFAGRLRETFGEVVANRWPVSLSIGAVACPAGCGLGLDELMAAADKLMYEVKHGGKNGLRTRLLD